MADGRGSEGDGTSGMSVEEEPDRSLVRLWGEVDLEVRRSAGDLCQAVADRALPVVIDARDVTFMDSTGMSILVRMARDAEAGGYPVEVRNAPWILQELLSITGVDRLLTLVDVDEDSSDPQVRAHGGRSDAAGAERDAGAEDEQPRANPDGLRSRP